VLYERLCAYYDRLAATTKRLEMTDILVGLFQEAEGDLTRVLHLTRGALAPDFAGIELGLADKLVVRALVFATGRKEDDIVACYHETGDLGDAAAVLLAAKGGGASRQMTLFGGDDEAASVAHVFDTLHHIAQASGAGSQDKKLVALQSLLAAAKPDEARYLIRTVTGRLRLGIADMTLLDALAQAFASKEERPVLERAYTLCSDLARVGEAVQTGGLDAVRAIAMQVGVPIRAMLAERLPTAQEILDKLGGEALCELKYDGLRLQAHVAAGGRVELYSRRLERLTEQFPDVCAALAEAFQGQAAIVEGEAVAVEPDTGDMRPFQDISGRRGRKHDMEKAVAEVPVTIFLFDCLMLDGDETMLRALPERRARLEAAFKTSEHVQFSHAEVVRDAAAVMAFFDRSVAMGAEGIMVKSLGADSLYRAGNRGWQWIKYKRDYASELNDSLDLVVVGAFMGRGRRAGWYGAFLMASYDAVSGRYETVCKLGTGFDDATLTHLTDTLKPQARDAPATDLTSKMQADVWFEPKLVLEVVGAELTLSPIHTAAWNAVREGAGLAVRFPRFTGRFRADKAPTDATTPAELLSLYGQQGIRNLE